MPTSVTRLCSLICLNKVNPDALKNQAVPERDSLTIHFF